MGTERVTKGHKWGRGDLAGALARRSPVTHSLCPAEPDPLPTGPQHLPRALWPPQRPIFQAAATAASKLHPSVCGSYLLRKAQRGHLSGCKVAPFLF